MVHERERRQREEEEKNENVEGWKDRSQTTHSHTRERNLTRTISRNKPFFFSFNSRPVLSLIRLLQNLLGMNQRSERINEVRNNLGSNFSPRFLCD